MLVKKVGSLSIWPAVLSVGKVGLEPAHFPAVLSVGKEGWEPADLASSS